MPTTEQVVYTMTVTLPPTGGGSLSSTHTYEKVAGAKIVPGEIPMILILDTEGKQRAIIAAAPGMVINCEATDTIKDVQLLKPGDFMDAQFSGINH